MLLFSASGVREIDQIISVLLRTSMAISGGIALLLDTIIPGTAEERGITKWGMLQGKDDNPVSNVASIHVYDLPFGLTNKWKIAKYLPFLPYYHEDTELDVIENIDVNSQKCHQDLFQSDKIASTCRL